LLISPAARATGKQHQHGDGESAANMRALQAAGCPGLRDRAVIFGFHSEVQPFLVADRIEKALVV